MNPIDLEVIYQSTLQIARELTLNMLRTGYSTIIKESQDFTFAIFDAQGRMVAQGIPQPLHIGPVAAQVNEVRRRFPDAAPGDAFIVNHPYQACQNHSTDVTIITPMFVGERIVGYIGNTAHKPDLGGKVPGTNSGDATDLFQEGLLAKIPNKADHNIVAVYTDYASDHKGEDWTCFPAVERIMAFTAQGNSTVRRNLDWLEVEGWISRSRCRSGSASTARARTCSSRSTRAGCPRWAWPTTWGSTASASCSSC